MSKTRTTGALLLIILLLVPLLPDTDLPASPSISHPDTRIALNVDKNQTYGTIQEAIENSNYGDTIRVFGGNYSENVYLWNGVKLQGSGSDKTFLSGVDADWSFYLYGSDCSLEGVTVMAKAEYAYGLLLYGNNAVIKDCVFRGGDYGIFCQSYQQGIKITECSFIDNEVGIYIAYADDIDINNNSFSCNNAGVHFESAVDAVVEDNEFQDCHLGLRYEPMMLATLTIGDRNTVNGRPLWMMMDKNNGTPPADCGQLILHNCRNIEVRNISLPKPMLLLIYESTNITVYNNKLRLGMDYCDDITLIDNEFILNTGVEISECHNSVFSRNTFKGGVYGILLYTGTSNRFDNNTIFECQNGFTVYYSMNCRFIDNIFYENGVTDLEIYEGYQHTIIRNSFRSPSTGIRILDSGYTSSLSGLHIITDNEFVDQNRALRISNSVGLVLKRNTMTACGITVFGYELEQWSSHTIDTTNKVDGRPIYYLVDRSGPKIPDDAAQLIMVGCSDFTISDKDFKNAAAGVELAYCSNVEMNNIESTGAYIGIIAAWCTNIRVTGLRTDDSYVGAYIANSENVTLKDLDISESSYGGIVLDGSVNCEIIGSKLNNGGILASSTRNSNITKNTCIGGKSGIELYSCWGLNVTENTCERNSRGIVLFDSHDSFVGNNTLQNTGTGFHIESTRSNILSANTIDRCDIGAYMHLSDTDHLLDNEFISNRLGVMINSSEQTFISNNTIRGSSGAGLSLNRTFRVSVISNHFVDNLGYGVALDPEGPYSLDYFVFKENNSKTVIYYNEFTNNNNGGAQAQDNGYQNEWNARFGGNRWSDHTGPDANDDGFVDTPYTIDGTASSRDLLPLMEAPLGDSDGDGYYDQVEDRFGSDPEDNRSRPPDADGDMMPDPADPDMDGDGLVNELDPDIDGDGHNNADDAFPEDPDRWEEEGVSIAVFLLIVIIFIIIISMAAIAAILVLRRRTHRGAKQSGKKDPLHPEGDETGDVEKVQDSKVK